MFELEALSKETGETTLLEQASSCSELSEEQLNSPIEKETIESNDITSEIQEQDITSIEELNTPIEKNDSTDNTELSLEDKVALQGETGWSDSIVDAIKSQEEANVYKEAGLKEVNGNLERTDIDWNAKIPQDRIERMRSLYGDKVADKWSGKTNMDLIKEGKAPYGPDNKLVNLHHIGQKSDSPLAELTETEHKTNDRILHNKTKVSEIERPVFEKERNAYWRKRYDELNNN